MDGTTLELLAQRIEDLEKRAAASEEKQRSMNAALSLIRMYTVGFMSMEEMKRRVAKIEEKQLPMLNRSGWPE